MLTAAAVMTVVSYVLVGVGPAHPRPAARLRRRRWPPPGVVRLLGRVLGPVATLLILLGNAITPGRGFRDGPFSSEVELRELVDMAEERGVVESGERNMIHSVFELGDTIAREVMVPRTDVVWIERTKTVRQALALALRSGFSRLPVIGENVDDVVGVVYLKDLVRRSQNTRRRSAARGSRSSCARRRSCPESKPVDELLRDMQAQRIHIAIVVDEYGGFAGLLTIEDILEEIVGEITDEHDAVQRPPVEELPDGVDAGHRPAAGRGPRRAVRRRTARGRRRRDRRRAARPRARPGADRGRDGRGRRAASWSPRAPADGATGSTRCWSAGSSRRRTTTPAAEDVAARVPPGRGGPRADGAAPHAWKADAPCPTCSPRTPSSSPSPAPPAAAPAPPRGPPCATPTAAPTSPRPSTLPSLKLSALQAAVAAAVSSGVEGLEAAAIVSAADAVEADGLAAVRDLTPSAPVHLAGPDGTLRTTA